MQPTLFTDRGRLHLEARHNYEDRGSGSLWAGINLSAGDDLALEFTPMLGVVLDPPAGIAPGYTWSELSISPSGRWRAGVVVQRTEACRSGCDIQCGVLAGLHRGRGR